jgi:hypothetical protein
MLRWVRFFGVVGLLLAYMAGTGGALGQDKPDAPTPKSTATSPQSQSGGVQNPGASADSNAPQDENPKRILGIIPNFQTRNDQPAAYEPMSVKEKYVLAWHQSVDISAHFGMRFRRCSSRPATGSLIMGRAGGHMRSALVLPRRTKLPRRSLSLDCCRTSCMMIRATSAKVRARFGIAFVMRLRER